MYDLSSSNPNPVINYEGVSKNVTGVGFQEEGKWMYTGGEDCSARIWDLRYCTVRHIFLNCGRAEDIAWILAPDVSSFMVYLTISGAHTVKDRMINE
jgi:WD40 repeat protein